MNRAIPTAVLFLCLFTNCNYYQNYTELKSLVGKRLVCRDIYANTPEEDFILQPDGTISGHVRLTFGAGNSDCTAGSWTLGFRSLEMLFACRKDYYDSLAQRRLQEQDSYRLVFSSMADVVAHFGKQRCGSEHTFE